jgi:putative chitinase
MAHGKTINREKFFTTVRKNIFNGRLTQGQVNGMNAILKAWDESVFTDLRWLGYMLATSYRETGATMLPIKEYGTYDYFERMYGPNGKRPAVARQMGNTRPGDGALFCGRGYAQMTWANNYKRAGKLVGVDLYRNPDLAMQPDIAAKILFAGMTDAEIIFEDFHDDQNFSFTGRTLEDYFNDMREDWYNARRIINGTDHAVMIAETAKDFFAALAYT